VKQALRDWSSQLFAASARASEGSPRPQMATLQGAFERRPLRERSSSEIRRPDKEALDIDVTPLPLRRVLPRLGEPSWARC